LNSTWNSFLVLDLALFLSYALLTLLIEPFIFWLYLRESKKMRELIGLCIVANFVSFIIGFLIYWVMS